jgi:hypothetical protein
VSHCSSTVLHLSKPGSGILLALLHGLSEGAGAVTSVHMSGSC